MSILEVNDVSIRYMTGDFKDIGLKEYVTRKLKGNYHVNEFWADKNISFTLEKGDMLGIIGTNGAGKSTLLKVVSGIMEPTGGYVKREGNIAALLELASGFDGDLTVRENAYLRGAMLGYTRRFMDEKYDEIIDFAELRDFQDRPFKQLSSGMKSRLAFSIASLVAPDILILDEVLSVGDGAFRKKSEDKMREIIAGGATTILVSHSIEQVRELCNKVLWLEHGKQVAFGDTKTLCDLYQQYLDRSITLEQAKKALGTSEEDNDDRGGTPPTGSTVPKAGDEQQGNGHRGDKMKKIDQCKSLFMAMLSAISLLGNAVIPTPEQVERLTGGATNPLLRFVAKLRLAMPDNGILGLVVFAGLWMLYRCYFSIKSQGERKGSKAFFALSAVLAATMVTGLSFKKFNSFAFVFENKFQMVYSALLFCGFFCLFYALSEIALRQMAARQMNNYEEKSGICALILDRRPFLGPFCVLILCWLPYWLAFFPGSAMWDAFRQFNYYFGIEKWSDHHPVFSTVVYGGLMQLGRSIHSDNMGLFFIALFQHLLFGGAIAYGMYALKKWGISQKVRVWVLIFFAFCPIIAFWPHSAMKDVSFDALILMFAISLLDAIRTLKRGAPSNKQLLGTTVFGVLASLMRHNGIYIVFASLLLLACLKAKEGKTKARVKAIACAVLAVVSVKTVSNTLITTVGAVKGSSGLALSVPFQQTARYVKEHGDEVTEEERQAIAAVLSYDRLAEIYDPDLSDPVKGTYKNDDSKLPAYLRVWFQMFLKHPMTYIEATISNSYSYFYPNGESTTKRLVYDLITYDKRINTGYLDLHYTNPKGGARNLLDGMLYVIKETPGLGLICHMGTYTWILLILIAVALYKEKRYLLLGCVPAVLNLLSCIASPVNGYLRYFLPNVLMIPVLIGWFIAELNPQKEQE